MKYLLIILILTACGQSNKSTDVSALLNDGNASDGNNAPNPLIGSWISECRNGFIIELAFNENMTNSRKIFNYADDDLNCEGDVQNITFLNRTYTLDGTKIDYTTTSCAVTPKTQAMADYFNNVFFFGYESWTPNKSKDLTGQGDACKKDSKMYTIVKITDGKLYGPSDDDIHDTTSPEERPVMYDMDFALTKE